MIERPFGQGLDFSEFDRQEREAAKARGRQRGAGGFRCPKCDKATGVTDSRPTEDGVRRRRACHVCGHRFSTIERLTDAGPEQPRDVTAAARRLILRVLANLPREGA